MKNTRSGSEAGFNLIEVLIATAILGTVVLSIMGLFFSGQFNVYGGKQMSQAVAVGTNAMEDLQSQSIGGLRSTFGITGATALATVDVDPARTLPNDTYTGSILRKTNAIATGQDPKGYLAEWRDQIRNNNKLGNGYVAVVMTPRKPAVGALTAGNATVMRLRVLVRWQENARWRQVVLDSVKAERP